MKPSVRVSDKRFPISESGQFRECSALERSLRSGRLAKRAKAGRSRVYCCGLARAKHRGLMLTSLAGRSLAAILLSWPICEASRPLVCARCVPDGLDSLRPSECSAANGAVAKLASPSRAPLGTVPTLGAQHKRRLGDVSVPDWPSCGKQKRRTGSAATVRPREERSDEMSNQLTFPRLTPRLNPWRT